MTARAEYLVVFVTARNRDEAEAIGAALVEERLAACVNVLTACRSIYRWKGKLVREDEVLMVVKTERKRFGTLERRVRELHSYEVPEVIAFPLTEISPSYADFLREALGVDSP